MALVSSFHEHTNHKLVRFIVLCFFLCFLSLPLVSARIPTAELSHATRLLSVSSPPLSEDSIQRKDINCPSGYHYRNGYCVRKMSTTGIIIRVIIAIFAVLFFSIAVYYCILFYRRRSNSRVVMSNMGTWQQNPWSQHTAYPNQPYPTNSAQSFPDSSRCEPSVQMGVPATYAQGVPVHNQNHNQNQH